jgi:hypothetical protein
LTQALIPTPPLPNDENAAILGKKKKKKKVNVSFDFEHFEE